MHKLHGCWRQWTAVGTPASELERWRVDPCSRWIRVRVRPDVMADAELEAALELHLREIPEIISGGPPLKTEGK